MLGALVIQKSLLMSLPSDTGNSSARYADVDLFSQQENKLDFHK